MTEAPVVTPTAAWLAEQEAKQAAYAARRRAWLRRFGRHDPAGYDDALEETAAPVPLAGGRAVAESTGLRERKRSPGGPVHDPRQGRFDF